MAGQIRPEVLDKRGLFPACAEDRKARELGGSGRDRLIYCQFSQARCTCSWEMSHGTQWTEEASEGAAG